MPQASHSVRAISAKSEISCASPPALMSPIAAAARPRVPGQVENTPEASFMPKVAFAFSLRELESTTTGMPFGVSSATWFSALIHCASWLGVGFWRRMKWRRPSV